MFFQYHYLPPNFLTVAAVNNTAAVGYFQKNIFLQIVRYGIDDIETIQVGVERACHTRIREIASVAGAPSQ